LELTSTVYPYFGFRTICEEVQPFRKVIEELDISDFALKILRDLFHIVDTNDSNSVDIDEFFCFFQFSYVTPMLARFFEVFDDDNSGELNLCEFVVAIWQFGANSDEGVIRFAFDIYDTDNSRYLGWEEVSTMLIEAWGGERHMTKSVADAVKYLRNQFEDALLDYFLDGRATFGMNKRQFGDFVRSNRATFFPLFTLQREIKRLVIGEKFWQQKNEDLDELHGNDRKMKFSFLKELAQKLGQIDDDVKGDEASEIERLSMSVDRLKMQLAKEREERTARRERRHRRRVREADPRAWRSMYDRATGRLYYHNIYTKRSSWEKPAALIFRDRESGVPTPCAEEGEEEEATKRDNYNGDAAATTARAKRDERKKKVVVVSVSRRRSRRRKRKVRVSPTSDTIRSTT